MKFSLNWICDFVDLKENNIQKISEILTEKSSEIEEFIDTHEHFKNVVVGEIKNIESHPEADKIRVTKIDIGEKELQIICGAKNIEVGQKVPVALIGAILPENFVIEKRKMRGVLSEGMLCSAKELGLGNNHEGIMILDKNIKNGTDFATTLNNQDFIIDIDNTTLTNRPDLFSHIGIAREMVACGIAEWKKTDQIKIDFPETKLSIKFSQDNNELCYARGNVEIANIKIEESPSWMKQRLENCGIRSINNLVDISNFVMLETGVPLHIFDSKTITKNIKIRVSKENEKITTLDGKEFTLPTDCIIQEDDEKIFDLAGIMGGENSEIKHNTEKILVHVPVYNPVKIRKASLKIKHRTHASTVYEKSVPTSNIKNATIRCVELIKQLIPDAKIISKLDFHEYKKFPKKKIKLEFRLIFRNLGFEIPKTEICQILKNMEFNFEERDDYLVVYVPPFRNKDIDIDQDLVEEIIRIYGVSNIKNKPIAVELRNTKKGNSKTKREIRNIMISLGFFEFITNSFLGEKLINKSGNIVDETFVEIKNSLSEDHRFLRKEITPNMLETIEENLKYSDCFDAFEIGNVFEIKKGKKNEHTSLTAIVAKKDFFELKGVLEELFNNFNLKIQLRDSENNFYKICLDIVCQNKTLGKIFMINNKQIKNFNLPKETSGFEINLNNFYDLVFSNKKIIKISKFPSTGFDLSVIVDKKTLTEKILKVLKNIHPCLSKLDILEIFTDEKLGNTKKSVTIQFEFTSNEKTLTNEEIQNIREKAICILNKNNFPFRF